MLEAAKLARTYVSGKSKDDFLRDIQCQDAVVHRLVIIGEAARRVSEETRSSLSSLPWIVSREDSVSLSRGDAAALILT
jgi:uncharacterized protein with HEPN domain